MGRGVPSGDRAPFAQGADRLGVVTEFGEYLVAVLADGGWMAPGAGVLAVLWWIGAFAVVSTIGRRFDRETTLDDYRGLGFESVGLSIALSIFMLSLAGFLPTAGFLGKLLVFKAAWNKGFSMLVVFGVLNSAASVYYYLRPIVLMYFSAPGEEDRRVPYVAASTVAALMLTIFGVFYLGMLPDLVLRFFAFGAR